MIDVIVAKDTPPLPHDTEWRRLYEIIKAAVPKMRRVMLQALRTVRSAVDVDRLERALARGDVDAAMAVIPMDHVAATINGDFAQQMREVFEAAGTVSARMIDGVSPFPFAIENPRALSWLQQHGAQLVTHITEDTRTALRQTLVRVLDEGMDHRQAAKLLREQIGLLPHHARAVERLRASLEAARDVSPARIERSVSAYADRLLAWRADTIARTEAAYAATNGQNESWRQAVDAGLVDARVAVRVWLSDPGTTHNACLEMDGQEVGLEEAFDYDGEPVLMPPAHPNCVCGVALRPSGSATAQRAGKAAVVVRWGHLVDAALVGRKQ